MARVQPWRSFDFYAPLFILAVVYVLVRIGHMTAYIAGRQPLRRAAFTLAQLVALAIFISPLFR